MMSPVLRLSRALSHAMNAPSVLATRAEVERKLATGRVVLFDVRDVDEIEQTGKLVHAGVTAITLPLPRVQDGALGLSDSEFQKEFGAPKPKKSEEIIFSCRSGRRSALACNVAMALGYDKVYNYAGSANDWFSS